MTADRQPETDTVRLHVAMAKLGNALGVQLDPKRPDHELVEQLAEAAEHADRYSQSLEFSLSLAELVEGGRECTPHDAGSFACVCPACTRAGDG